jgi:hypothetical protein
MSQPNFYAIIPASVRYDSTIIPNAKLLYGEITAMCNTEGYCWAENSYFATLYSVSMYTISRWISQLEKGNYINTELNKKEGNTRKIFIVDASVTLLTKSAKPIDEKRKRVLTKIAKPIDEKRKSIYENITINNTINRESTSLAFFEVNFPSEFERLMMQYKSQIINWDDFVKSFEATVDQEGLEFKLNVLRGRFGKYAQNWIRNQNKFNGKVVELVPNGPIKKINSL